MALNSVVLPAPLGPINPTISFSSAWKSTLLTAMRPPKALTSCVVSSTRMGSVAGIGPHLPFLFRLVLAAGPHLQLHAHGPEQALRAEDHEEHQDQPQGDPARLRVGLHEGEVAQPLLKRYPDGRAEDGADDVAHAAEYHQAQDQERLHEHEAARRDVVEVVPEEHAHGAGEERPRGVRQQLVARGVDAHRLGRHLVFADGRPGAADARAHDPRDRPEREQRQGETEEVEALLRGELEAEERGLSLIHISEPTRLGMISYA